MHSHNQKVGINGQSQSWTQCAGQWVGQNAPSCLSQNATILFSLLVPLSLCLVAVIFTIVAATLPSIITVIY